MGLVLRLVETRADGETSSVDVPELSHPGDLRDIASLGLTLPEAKQILASCNTVVVAQARDHASLRPECSHHGSRCYTKDWQSCQIATPFGTMAVRLPWFHCSGCGHGET